MDTSRFKSLILVLALVFSISSEHLSAFQDAGCHMPKQGPTGPTGPSGATGATGPTGASSAQFFGAFSAIGNQTLQFNNVIDVDFNTTIASFGITHPTSSTFQVSNSGYYLVSWSYIAQNNTFTAGNLQTWIDIAGVTTLPNPKSDLSVLAAPPSNTTSVSAAGSQVFFINPGENLKLQVFSTLVDSPSNRIGNAIISFQYLGP